MLYPSTTCIRGYLYPPSSFIKTKRRYGFSLWIWMCTKGLWSLLFYLTTDNHDSDCWNIVAGRGNGRKHGSLPPSTLPMRSSSLSRSHTKVGHPSSTKAATTVRKHAQTFKLDTTFHMLASLPSNKLDQKATSSPEKNVSARCLLGSCPIVSHCKHCLLGKNWIGTL